MAAAAPLLLGRAPGGPPTKTRMYGRCEAEDVCLDTLTRQLLATRRLQRGIDFFGRLVRPRGLTPFCSRGRSPRTPSPLPPPARRVSSGLGLV